MPTTMTTHERVSRMYAHREADRIPVTDDPWGATIERWAREGMPAGVSYVDYFDLDRFAGIGVDTSPRYPAVVIEETEDYAISTTAWGATLKNWKHAASTPEFLDFTIKDRETWNAARARMTPDPARVNWAMLEKHYPTWRSEGYWIEAGFWFGFDITHSWNVGTERLLMAMLEDPEWCVEMFNHELDMCISHFEMIWERGYPFDSIRWPDDMGYKQHTFFSLETYRALLKPVHQRAIDWAHARGIKARLHSCGDVHTFLPEFIEMGLDGLNPLEVKAGMDPIAIKRQYGDRLLLHGGLNAVLWDDTEAITTEMRRILPVAKEHGGYIFSSDHSVPSSVSLDNFRVIINLAKELGSYA